MWENWNCKLILNSRKSLDSSYNVLLWCVANGKRCSSRIRIKKENVHASHDVICMGPAEKTILLLALTTESLFCMQKGAQALMNDLIWMQFNTWCFGCLLLSWPIQKLPLCGWLQSLNMYDDDDGRVNPSQLSIVCGVVCACVSHVTWPRLSDTHSPVTRSTGARGPS